MKVSRHGTRAIGSYLLLNSTDSHACNGLARVPWRDSWRAVDLFEIETSPETRIIIGATLVVYFGQAMEPRL